MDIKAKLRPFYVAKMLYEQTDEEHYLTIAQIIDQLKNQYGISTSRGTVGDDIKALQEFGVEIEVEQSTQKHDGKVYLFNPYKMIWNGDYYYVVGYSEKHGSIGSFRVDRIVTTPQILTEEQHEPPKDFDLNVYLNSMFRMYNGERKQVELICENDIMDAIIDKFGKDVDVSVYDENSFKAIVITSVGNVFYSWIFGFGGRVYISSPDDVKEEYSKMVSAAVAALKY